MNKAASFSSMLSEIKMKKIEKVQQSKVPDIVHVHEDYLGKHGTERDRHGDRALTCIFSRQPRQHPVPAVQRAGQSGGQRGGGGRGLEPRGQRHEPARAGGRASGRGQARPALAAGEGSQGGQHLQIIST